MKLKGKRILVVGASSDIALPLNEMLLDSQVMAGLHYYSNETALKKYMENRSLRKFKKNLNSSRVCHDLVDEFVGWAGGIDGLVQLSGGLLEPAYWDILEQKHWDNDLHANLVAPFFLAQRAVKHMKQIGGRIILTSTASASHGGGGTSLAYGAAKAGIECITKGLARDCAKYNILVNAIAPGFINTKFHVETMKRTEQELQKRVELIPLKRAGTPEEVAGTIMFLLSEHASYITGETIVVSGGDWL